MIKFIAYVAPGEEPGLFIVFPAELSGVPVENVYESGMQEPQLRRLDLRPYTQRLVAFEAQTFNGDVYGATMLEEAELTPGFIKLIEEEIAGRNSSSGEEPDFFQDRDMALAEAESRVALPASFNELVNVPGGASFRKGIDISHHNVLNDWNAIRNAGVSFVYIKISEGVGTPDSKAKTHAAAARNAGLQIGYYHFGRPDKKHGGGTVSGDATAEAQEVKSLLSNLPAADLPLMLDLEDVVKNGRVAWDSPLPPAEYLAWVEKFLGFFHDQAQPAKAPLIYSRKNYLDAKLPNTHTLGSRYKLWLSRYTADYKKSQPVKGWSDWTVWQFTEAGKLGNNLDLDLNIARM